MLHSLSVLPSSPTSTESHTHFTTTCVHAKTQQAALHAKDDMQHIAETCPNASVPRHSARNRVLFRVLLSLGIAILCVYCLEGYEAQIRLRLPLSFHDKFLAAHAPVCVDSLCREPGTNMLETQSASTSTAEELARSCHEKGTPAWPAVQPAPSKR